MGKAKKDGGGAAADDLASLLERGDHAAARREATRLAGDPGAAEAARTAARTVLVSLRPEPAAVLVGMGCVVLAAAILVRVLAG